MKFKGWKAMVSFVVSYTFWMVAMSLLVMLWILDLDFLKMWMFMVFGPIGILALCKLVDLLSKRAGVKPNSIMALTLMEIWNLPGELLTK